MLTEDAEITERFNRVARILGNRVFGVDLGVDISGDRLIFVNEDGDPILNDGEEIIAATREEIQSKQILDFAVRALRAGGIAKMLEIERSRAP